MNCSLIILSVLFIITRCLSEDYIVEIEQGQLNGTVKYNRKGGLFYSFQRIPYAKPPVGELRFRQPEPADAWDGILDATEDVPQCYQGNWEGQEDCLYLNVYTPQLSDSYDTLLDVMVWIHGGGNIQGSAREYEWGPDYILTEDVVLVAMNYRLVIFGSFNLDDPSLGYPGNLLMKDQVLALQWVQSNIEKFGGNPNSVTIFGESAGAVSVHFHVLSPLSAGLFHRAIVESGGALCPWSMGVENNGILLAEALDIPTDNLTETMSQLLSLSGYDVHTGSRTVHNQIQQNIKWNTIGYPIIENEVEGQNAFLTEAPLSIIQAGAYNNVTMMIGYNDAEGILYLSQFKTLRRLIPDDLNIDDDSVEAEEFVQRLLNFYNEDSEDLTDNAIIQMFTDTWFGFPMYRTAREHLRTTSNPIYFYRFAADTSLNLWKLRSETTAQFPGATHSDELGYLFSNYMTPDGIETNSVEDLAIDRMVKLWTNFAKYGTPTPDDFTDFEWLPVSESAFNYAGIETTETIPDVDPDPDNIEFWAGIYDQYFPSRS